MDRVSGVSCISGNTWQWRSRFIGGSSCKSLPLSQLRSHMSMVEMSSEAREALSAPTKVCSLTHLPLCLLSQVFELQLHRRIAAMYYSVGNLT